MTYRNMEITFDEKGSILATRVSVDFSTKNQINRQLAANIDPDDQLRFEGDVDCKISFDFVLKSDDDGFERQWFMYDVYNGTGSNSGVLDIGGNTYSGCYIDSYSLTVKPFEPVVGSASFTSYRPSTSNITASESENVNNALDTNDIVYGHTCSLSGAGNVVSSNIINNFTYSKTYSRTPVYTLGSQFASDHLVDSVEVDVSVDSTGLNSIIDFSGNKLTSTFGIALRDVAGDGMTDDYSDFDLIVSSGAHVIAEGYSVNGGDTLVTKASIKEVIL